MSQDNKKTLSEDATGLAQFVYEGMEFAKKLGQKWSHAWREIEIIRLKSTGYMAESEGFEP